MKLILNKCYGGFGISPEGYALYAKKKGLPLYAYYYNWNDKTMRKTSLDDRKNIVDYFTKDFGDIAPAENDKWDYALRLYGDKYRQDPVLIEVVEELGDKANGRYAALKIVEVPDGLTYVVDDYDGIETLHEDVPTW